MDAACDHMSAHLADFSDQEMAGALRAISRLSSTPTVDGGSSPLQDSETYTQLANQVRVRVCV